MKSVQAFQALQFRVLANTQPRPGVTVEITISTPSGEQTLPAFWLPPEAARDLANALLRKRGEAQGYS